MWRACQNILPTKDNLVKRKIIQDPFCPICGLEQEISFHILWDCPSARDVWGVNLRVFQNRFQLGLNLSKQWKVFTKTVTEKCSTCLLKYHTRYGYEGMIGYIMVYSLTRIY
jgi:hypothetical protein